MSWWVFCTSRLSAGIQVFKQTSKTSQITVKILQRAADWRWDFHSSEIVHTRSVDGLIKTWILFKLWSVDALAVFIIRESWWGVMYDVQFTADRNVDRKAMKPSDIISSSRLMHFQPSIPSAFWTWHRQSLEIQLPACSWLGLTRFAYIVHGKIWQTISKCLPTHTWSHERRRNLKLYAISHGDNWDQREVNYPTELLLCIPKSLTRYRFGSLSVLFLFPAASRINESGSKLRVAGLEC